MDTRSNGVYPGPKQKGKSNPWLMFVLGAILAFTWLGIYVSVERQTSKKTEELIQLLRQRYGPNITRPFEPSNGR